MIHFDSRLPSTMGRTPAAQKALHVILAIHRHAFRGTPQRNQLGLAPAVVAQSLNAISWLRGQLVTVIAYDDDHTYWLLKPTHPAHVACFYFPMPEHDAYWRPASVEDVVQHLHNYHQSHHTLVLKMFDAAHPAELPPQLHHALDDLEHVRQPIAADNHHNDGEPMVKDGEVHLPPAHVQAASDRLRHVSQWIATCHEMDVDLHHAVELRDLLTAS